MMLRYEAIKEGFLSQTDTTEGLLVAHSLISEADVERRRALRHLALERRVPREVRRVGRRLLHVADAHRHAPFIIAVELRPRPAHLVQDHDGSVRHRRQAQAG